MSIIIENNIGIYYLYELKIEKNHLLNHQNEPINLFYY